ncbi:CTP synthase [Candidatus Microgenomates bacterium]|nr:CTP synthase [Candidatus Microgenomates bacterium]
MSKYIFVSGGVISGIGKGVSAASIGFLLKSYGKKITMIKADQYLNVDAGTMNPLEHGETFVLDDGFETDMDIGTYERFTNQSFTRPNSMTCGAIFERVINKERALGYQGKWVSIDHHIPGEIVNWFEEVSKKEGSDITIIEIGGTVGEIGNGLILEANKMMKLANPNDVIHIHVAYLPVPPMLGEMKTKPAQMSVEELNKHAIHPDFIIGRSEVALDDVRIEKLSKYCFVKASHVIPAPDVKCIYDIPINFEKFDFGKKILKSLGLRSKDNPLYSKWKKKVEGIKKLKQEVNIGIVGKYFKSGNFDLKDSYVSVLEAVNHSCWEFGIKPNIHWIVSDELEKNPNMLEELGKLDGIIVPQGWGSRGSEGKIMAIKYVRENKIPYLGLCYGMQMAVVEYARNVLNLKDANSEEINPKSKNKVIHLMDSQKKLIEKKEYGGTIRLGSYPCAVDLKSLLYSTYKKYGNGLYHTLPDIDERHRHRYEFNNEYRELFEKSDMKLVGKSPDGLLIEAVEISKEKHPFFIGTQYHPELKSRFLEPHPLFLGFVKACMKKK